jgi:CBS domain containing-hemolysin-like protein
MSSAHLLSAFSAFAAVSGWMLATSFFATLYASLLVSQEAGLERLAEKYPAATESIERNRVRWNLLRLAVFLAAIGTLMAAVFSCVQALDPESAGHPWKLGMVLVAATVGLVLALEIIPRVLSEGYADLISMRGLPIAVLLSRLLFPLAYPLTRLEQKLMTWTMSEADGDNRPSHEDEILYLVEHAST